MIKIDVEGFEPQVIAGLTETIAESRPIIIFEHIWLDDRQVQAVVPNNYSLVFILDDHTTTRDFSRRRLGANAILVPRENAAAQAALVERVDAAERGGRANGQAMQEAA